MFFGRQRNDNYSHQNEDFINLIRKNDSEALSNFFQNNKDAIFYIDEVNKKDTQTERDDNFVGDRITLLHAAAYYDSLECFCYLHYEQGMELRTLSARSFLPLHYACYNGSKEVVAFILDEDPDEAKNFRDNLILCIAIQGGVPEILEELFKKGSKLYKPRSKFDDPINKAISIDNYRCCEILVKYSDEYNSDYTSAMTAAKMVNPDLLFYFVKKSSDLAYNEQIQTSVFMLIFEISHGDIFRKMIIKWLSLYDDLELEPPYNLKGVNGVCHWVCKMADQDVANLMLRTKNVLINRIGANNHLGTYYLANKNNITDNQIIKIFDILLSNNFDLNFQPKDNFCEPTLKYFLRTIKIRYDVIEYLVERDASPYLKWSADGKSTILDEIKKRQNDKRLLQIFDRFINESQE